jgi:hypothetical protein
VRAFCAADIRGKLAVAVAGSGLRDGIPGRSLKQ